MFPIFLTIFAIWNGREHLRVTGNLFSLSRKHTMPFYLTFFCLSAVYDIFLWQTDPWVVSVLLHMGNVVPKEYLLVLHCQQFARLFFVSYKNTGIGTPCFFPFACVLLDDTGICQTISHLDANLGRYQCDDVIPFYVSIYSKRGRALLNWFLNKLDIE